jgi:hypothetical protein
MELVGHKLPYHVHRLGLKGGLLEHESIGTAEFFFNT